MQSWFSAVNIVPANFISLQNLCFADYFLNFVIFEFFHCLCSLLFIFLVSLVRRYEGTLSAGLVGFISFLPFVGYGIPVN